MNLIRNLIIIKMLKYLETAFTLTLTSALTLHNGIPDVVIMMKRTLVMMIEMVIIIMIMIMLRAPEKAFALTFPLSLSLNKMFIPEYISY